MTNADKFKNIFGLYATELWSMPEKDFLKWLNSEVMSCSEIPNSSDCISRQAAIDAVDSETVSTNPEHFKSSEKFIKFMDDVDIASFGKWKWANGFNTALIATRVQLKKLPSAEPERKTGKWIEYPNHMAYKCSECGRIIQTTDGRRNVSKHYPFCHCGAMMGGDSE